MRNILLALTFLGLLFISAINKSEDYFMIYDDPSIASLYQYGRFSYLDYFLKDKLFINNQEYSIRIRKYSYSSTDTAYFRKGVDNFYSYDEKTQKESILIPIDPKLNQKWHEADSSWSYEVIKVNQTFDTPSKKYKNCIVLECKQLTNRDKRKSSIYHLYYSKGYGYVGDMSVNTNSVSSYLKQVVKNPKEGTVIGK